MSSLLIFRGDSCLNACLAAFECGYRHIDTAQMYNNESQVGEAIRQSGLKREEIFITTKLKSNQHGASNVEKACRGKLDRTIQIKYDITINQNFIS
jgi:diketogulonate reductase-like aldo/keto reductase